MTKAWNGSTAQNDVRGTETITDDGNIQLPQLAAQVHAQVAAFLKADTLISRVNGDLGAFAAKDSDPTAPADLLRRTQEQTALTLRILEDALERYSLEELSLSYNGGKDCLVLLILYLSALHTHSQKTKTQLPARLHSVYIVSPHPFDEVEEFVVSSTATYHLDLVRYEKPMREAFEEYLADSKNIKAILVGTRRTDPHGGKLQWFDRTDHGWPDFMRVHPVIEWGYAEIWAFLRHLNIPYCNLYDEGYTSLGGTTDTLKNPALMFHHRNGDPKWLPAYRLQKGGEERLGRDRN